MDVGLNEEARDTFVLQEATTEAATQDAGSSHAEDLLEMFGDSEGEAKPIAETRAARRTRATVVESLESEPEDQHRPSLSIPVSRAILTNKRTRTQTTKTSQSSKSSTSSATEEGRKKQKASSK